VAGAVILLITRYGVAARGTTDTSLRGADDSRRPRRRWRRLAIAAASIAALLLIVAAVFIADFDVQFRRGVGERSYAVVAMRELRSDYRLGIGTLRLDLHSLALPVGETHVEARVDVGELRVVVPDGVALRVRGDVQLGELHLPGKSVEGYDVDADLDERGARVLVLDAHVGLGSARVIRPVP
jgi:hypothetical protein